MLHDPNEVGLSDQVVLAFPISAVWTSKMASACERRVLGSQ